MCVSEDERLGGVGGQVCIMMKHSEKTPSSSSTQWPITAITTLCISKTHSCLFHLHKTTEWSSCYPATHSRTHTHDSHLRFSPFSQCHELWKRVNGTSNTPSLHLEVYTLHTHTHTYTQVHYDTQNLMFSHLHTYTQHIQNVYAHSLTLIFQLNVKTSFTAPGSQRKSQSTIRGLMKHDCSDSDRCMMTLKAQLSN